MFNRKSDKKDNINPELASQMLENVFAACEVEPNSVPLEELEAYSNYRKDKFAFRKTLLIIILLIFLAIPLLFIQPNVQLHKTTGDDGSSRYEVTVSSLLPTTSVKATVDGSNTPVYEKSKGAYIVEPSEAGTLTVTVTALNHQYNTVTASVNASDIDSETPVVVKDTVSNGKLYIYLKDNKGINYKKIYAVNNNGERINIDSMTYNSKENYIALDYPGESLNLFIPDTSGNTLQLVLTIK